MSYEQQAEDVVRSLWKLNRWTDREVMIRKLSDKCVASVLALLKDLIHMPEAEAHPAGHKVLVGLHSLCNKRLKFLLGMDRIRKEEQMCRERERKRLLGLIETTEPGTLVGLGAVGRTGRSAWLMKTLPLDDESKRTVFVLLNSDLSASTQIDTELINVLEQGKLYKAKVPSAAIYRYLMSAVIKGEPDRKVLLQIPGWVIRTAGERADKYLEVKKEDKQ